MEITNNLSEKALCDYKIVCRAIAGEEKAYTELLKKYKDSVYFMILKIKHLDSTFLVYAVIKPP